jgi:tetratricopeptide (TPR) repeat protein
MPNGSLSSPPDQPPRTGKTTGIRQTRVLLTAGVLLACTIIAYLPAIHSGFIWDDDDNVTNNACLRNLGGLAAIWLKPGATQQYYPLTHTSFWVEYHLWGLRPAPYHVTNVLLHAAAALALWRVLVRLSVPGAGLAAAVFLLHPVCVESVAWITQRKNTLSELCCLLAVWAYLRFDPPQSPRPSDRRWRWYGLAAVLFLMALWSKTTTVTLPAALAVVYWWKRPKMVWGSFWPLLPLLAAAVGMGAVTAWVERAYLGATGPEWELTAVQRVLVAGRIVWFYAAKLLWPHPLMFIYPRWTIDPSVWWWYLCPVSLLAALGALVLMRRRIGKGPAAAALMFCILLVPVLWFISGYATLFSYVADHWLYLACPVLIALVCAALARIAARLRIPGQLGRDVLGAVILVVLGAMTWQQAEIYRDSETLWQDTLRQNPDCWLAHSNLATLYHITYYRAEAARNPAAAQAALEKAAAHCLRVVQLRPNVASSQYSLGVVYADLGRHIEAIACFRKALACSRGHPSEDAVVHLALARSLVSAGHVDEGIAHYREALTLRPKLVEASHYLAVTLINEGRWNEAEVVLRQALAMGAVIPEIRTDLAVTLEKKGDLAGAAECYRTLLAADPHDGLAHRHLAMVLAKLGKTEEATAEFNESIRLLGLDSRAAAEFRKALQEATGAGTPGAQ